MGQEPEGSSVVLTSRSQSRCPLGCSLVEACLGGPPPSSCLENSCWQEASVPATWLSPQGCLSILSAWQPTSSKSKRSGEPGTACSAFGLGWYVACPRVHNLLFMSSESHIQGEGIPLHLLEGGASENLGHTLKPPCPSNRDEAGTFIHSKRKEYLLRSGFWG